MLLLILTVLQYEFYPKSIALFSPHDNPEASLVGLIRKVKKSISAAVFSITNKQITDALIAAHKRGVKIEIITDISTIQTPSGKADVLKNAGIDILVFKPRNSRSRYRPLMHNKFAVFDCNEKEKWIWTGSFNWTRSANIFNHENVILTSNKSIFERYKKHFEVLKKECMFSRVQKSQEIKNTANETTVGKIKSMLFELKNQLTKTQGK
jgi:phosphatidylserine/phosphatidylglycerophosphate/cardiolipin synthase-like enzyme